EKVLLRKFVVLRADAHVERCAADTIDVETRGAARISARAVRRDGLNLEAVRAIRIGGRAVRTEIVRESHAERRPRPGRKAAARELEPVPRLEDERRAGAVVVPV